MILIEQVGQYLEDQGVGTVGTNIFLGYQPETPDNCVAVILTAGSTPSIDIPTKEPRFQILIRNTNHETGNNKLNTIRDLLHQFKNSELVSGQTYFYYIFAVNEGGTIGRDPNGRDEWSINFYTKTR